MTKSLLTLAAILTLSITTYSQTKLLRFPDIRGDRVVFTYGGDLWTAPAAGGNAVHLTTHPGVEVFGKFSPDGKWIAFVSFGLDVDLGDHPPNRNVMLRIMPTDGSAPPRVLTRLFGGQGTMNVPSWSPDSKSIAFVSYRLVR